MIYPRSPARPIAAAQVEIRSTIFRVTFFCRRTFSRHRPSISEQNYSIDLIAGVLRTSPATPSPTFSLRLFSGQL
jgi:hypothetical protein